MSGFRCVRLVHTSNRPSLFPSQQACIRETTLRSTTLRCVASDRPLCRVETFHTPGIKLSSNFFLVHIWAPWTDHLPRWWWATSPQRCAVCVSLRVGTNLSRDSSFVLLNQRTRCGLELSYESWDSEFTFVLFWALCEWRKEQIESIELILIMSDSRNGNNAEMASLVSAFQNVCIFSSSHQLQDRSHKIFRICGRIHISQTEPSFSRGDAPRE